MLLLLIGDQVVILFQEVVRWLDRLDFEVGLSYVIVPPHRRCAKITLHLTVAGRITLARRRVGHLVIVCEDLYRLVFVSLSPSDRIYSVVRDLRRLQT